MQETQALRLFFNRSSPESRVDGFIITDLTTNLKAEIMNHDLTSDLGIQNRKINTITRNPIELIIGYQNKHNYQLFNRSSEISAAKIRLTPWIKSEQLDPCRYVIDR
ncbi:hypothetical protein F2Q69_00057954 [Brassica cretica]|uniref:Uncharacterized protein n=1 Tax=Brassica cretica TaxID=69181 RepID=A0A8S9MSX6_BRACR|nr:hypothetical protein F2Q69_00057954 [Brassica cretica]